MRPFNSHCLQPDIWRSEHHSMWQVYLTLGTKGLNSPNLFFFVVPCILITLKFLFFTNKCTFYWTYNAMQRASSTHTTIWKTCCHNTALLIMMYLYWLFLHKCNFSQAQCKLPEDLPSGPKHVGANIRYFNVIKMHGTMTKIKKTILYSSCVLYIGLMMAWLKRNM